MTTPEKSIPSEQELMAPVQAIADSFAHTLLHDSPLSPVLTEQVESERTRIASMKHPVRFPYASIRLFSTHPDYPNHEISTTLHIVRKPDGKYLTKSVRQTLDTTDPMRRSYPYDNFAHETFLNAFGGVSGLIFSREVRNRNPRDHNGWYSLEIQYGFGPNGKLFSRIYPPKHSLKTRLILFQAYSDARIEDPERIEMHFPLQWRREFAFPDAMYLQFPTKQETAVRVPYDQHRLTLLERRGIILPTSAGITKTGEYFMDISLMSDAEYGEGQRVFVPSSVDIYKETLYKLQLAVSPQGPVSTIPPHHAHLRNNANTWRPDGPIV